MKKIIMIEIIIICLILLSTPALAKPKYGHSADNITNGTIRGWLAVNDNIKTKGLCVGNNCQANPNIPSTSNYLGLKESGSFIQKSIVNKSLGFEFVSGVKSELIADSGGQYEGAAQAAYPAFNGEVVMKTQGQAIGYHSYIKSLGIGNALHEDSVLESWGGSGAYWSVASVPEIAVGEYEIVQGASQDGKNIFRANINQKISDTIYKYEPVTNEDALGSRFLLNLNKKMSQGQVVAVGGTMVTFSGIDWSTVSPSPIGQYLKIGSTNDLYDGTWNSNNPEKRGDDVIMDGGYVGHWYRVVGISSNPSSTSSKNALVLDQTYDTENLKTSGDYLLAQGAVIKKFDTTAKTIELDKPNSWSVGDHIYSPPNHIMNFNGINMIFRKKYKTGSMTAHSDGIRLVNFGPEKMDKAIRITGSWAKPGDGGFRRGIVFESFNGDIGIDLSKTTFKDSPIKLGSGAPIKWSSGEAIKADSGNLDIVAANTNVQNLKVTGTASGTNKGCRLVSASAVQSRAYDAGSKASCDSTKEILMGGACKISNSATAGTASSIHTNSAGEPDYYECILTGTSSGEWVTAQAICCPR